MSQAARSSLIRRPLATHLGAALMIERSFPFDNVLNIDCAERNAGHGAQRLLARCSLFCFCYRRLRTTAHPRANMSSAAPHSSLNIFATTGLFFLLAFSRVNAQLLANGSYFQSGSISTNWLWQASGGLTHGRCPWIVSRVMSDCYKMYVVVPDSSGGTSSDRRLHLQRSLDPTGNLESTTQADYLAALKKPAGSRQRRTIDFDAPKADSNRLHLIEVAASHAASTEDYALDAYFEAFPEQAKFRYVAQPDSDPTKVRTCRCIQAGDPPY